MNTFSPALLADFLALTKRSDFDLQSTLDWIKDNIEPLELVSENELQHSYYPEGIFTEKQLETWAESNSFHKRIEDFDLEDVKEYIKKECVISELFFDTEIVEYVEDNGLAFSTKTLVKKVEAVKAIVERALNEILADY